MPDARAHADVCRPMADALDPPEPFVPLFGVQDDVSLLTTAVAVSEDGPAWLDIAFWYCPFCGAGLSRSDESA